MKRTVLTLCIGMMIGLLAGSMSGVFAAVGDTVEAIVAEYTIMVDGKEQVLETSPVAINDSTYVPLRAMANMLGKDVTYKADSRTIELNTPDTEVIEGVTITDTTGNLEAIIYQINLLKPQISETEEMIVRYEKMEQDLLDGTDNDIALKSTRGNLAFFKSELLKNKQQLADFEAQKASLEAH